MGIDGSDAKRLTHTAEDMDANISPDGRWVAYTSCLNKCTVWKVGIDGGQPVQLTDKFSQAPVFSPDGKQIACRYLDQPNGQYQLAILPSEGGAPIKTFPLANGVTNRRWTVDGRALIYGVTQKGITNLWAQPIDGSPPKQLTNFASELIFGFDLSRDGKQVAMDRGTRSSDVVLMSNFKR
jgi:Tol biopolymer transport system component